MSSSSPPDSPAGAEAAPEPAGVVFGDRLECAERYSGHLATTGVEWGLIGPRELPRLWRRHILNCAVVTDLLHAGDDVADIGSGAGLPGLAMAIRRPDLGFTLIEPLQRRTQWLEMVVSDLELDNVEVLRARAEDLAGTRRFTAVTARAVASMAGLTPWTLPLTGPHGRVLAIKGESAEEEIAKARQTLRSFGAVQWQIVSLGDDLLETPTRVVEVVVGQNGGKIPGSKKRG